jgi:hypothetical protein
MFWYFVLYLASPRAGTKTSGFYLHFPASEEIWMVASMVKDRDLSRYIL